MRRDLAAVGAALVVAGAAVSRSPGLGGVLSGSVTRTVLAALGVGVALSAIVVSLDGDGEGGTADDRKTAATGGNGAAGAALGAEFDATLARIEGMSSTELRRSEAPVEVRRRLREAAIATVVRRAGVDRETATRRVETGEWTDDPVAAAFLGAPRASAPVRWRETLSATPRTVSRARRTADLLEAEL
jgi:hypothetical protein